MSLFNEHEIVVFTDGASKGNPGPGGWGVVIVTPDGRVTELGGGSPQTTNNKMELTGAIEALSRLHDTPGGRSPRGRGGWGRSLAGSRYQASPERSFG